MPTTKRRGPVPKVDDAKLIKFIAKNTFEATCGPDLGEVAEFLGITRMGASQRLANIGAEKAPKGYVLK